MISLKKVFVAAAVATLGFGLFAQSSKTNAATAGLFSTDVDNFVDVNEWSTVNPEKFFGYFGMNDGNYNVGFAKQFEKFYWGTYYDGNIGDSSKKTYDAKTTADTTVTNWGDLTFANLFGFGNIGIKATLNFSGSKSVTEQKEPSVTTTEDSTSFYGSVRAGLTSFDLAGFNTKPYAYISFDTNSNYGTKKDVTNKDTEDNRRKSFGIGAGAEVTLSESETTTQAVSAAVHFTNYTPYDTDRAAKATDFYLPLDYKVTYKASENLSLALGASADIDYNTSDNSKTKVKTSTFEFTPSLATGLTYDTKKKVIFNAGVGFTVPSYTNRKTDTDGKVDTTSEWNGADCNLTWSSGFNWVPTKNVSVDCSYQILDNLIGGSGNNTRSADMETDFTEGYSKNFWETVNKALVHNIGFSVSVKF